MQYANDEYRTMNGIHLDFVYLVKAAVKHLWGLKILKTQTTLRAGAWS